MKQLLLILLLISGACFASDLYPPLTDYSFDGVTKWALPRIASGSALPPIASASEGELFLNLATPTIPLLNIMMNGAWTRMDFGLTSTQYSDMNAAKKADRVAADAVLAQSWAVNTGSASQYFNVAAPTQPYHAVPLSWLDSNTVATSSLATASRYDIPDWNSTNWYAANASSGLFLSALLSVPAAPASFTCKALVGGVTFGYYISLVNLPNGVVAMIPDTNDSIGLYNLKANVITAGAVASTTDHLWLGDTNAFSYVQGRNSHILFRDKVIMIPLNCDTFGIYNWITNTFSMGCTASTTDALWADAVLAPNGKIVMMPVAGNNRPIGLYDPVANSYTTSAVTIASAANWQNCILAPNNKVYFMPSNVGSSSIGIYDVANDTFSYSLCFTTASQSWQVADSCLLPNGKIFILPSEGNYSQPKFCLYDPATNATSASSVGQTQAGNDILMSCQLRGDGKVILFPSSVGFELIYDPVTDTVEKGQDMALSTGNYLYHYPLLTMSGDFLALGKRTIYTFCRIYMMTTPLRPEAVTNPWMHQ